MASSHGFKKRCLLILFCFGLKAVAAETFFPLEHDIRRPADVDCTDRPEWDSFRRASIAHSRRGWPASADGLDAAAAQETRELEVAARGLVDKWLWMVCKEDCQTTQHLTWQFVEEWGARCQSSAHFDRYLVTHYFRNRQVPYHKREPSEFCHFGMLTALVIAAQFEFPFSVAQAKRMLYLAFVLLGDFLTFDWLSSSTWPIDSMLVLLNVHMVSQFLITGQQLENVRASGKLPGLAGPDFVRLHSRWQGTSEAGKRTARPAEQDMLEKMPELRIWQIDGHTALAGEAKTMLTRFTEAVQVRVTFLGNSLAGNVCRNYGLCPNVADRELLQSLLDRYYEKKDSFETVASAWEAALGPRLSREADVLMCGQPLSWCRFLLGLNKPIFLYVGLPVIWSVREEDRKGWAEDFYRILVGQQHVVISMSVFMARSVQWQFGVRPPALRVLGLHAQTVYVPLRNASVLVSRFGTSGALSECMLQQYVQANKDWFPLEFVQMEAVLFEEHLALTKTSTYGDASKWQDHTAEIKVPGMPYGKFASHRAAVCMPYDTTIFLFNEIYSANMPVFVPKDLWRWMIGPSTSPSMEFLFDWENRHPSYIHGPGPQHEPIPQSSPFFASVHQPMGVEQALEWAAYCDWAMLPHVLYFTGVPDLFLQLMDTDTLRTTSAKMRAFNDEELVLALSSWRNVAHRLLYAVRLSAPLT